MKINVGRLLLVGSPALSAVLAWGLTSAFWPGIAKGLAGPSQQYFLRSEPLTILILPVVVGLIVMASLPLHLRRPIPASTFLTYLVIAAIYGLREYYRLAPYAKKYGMGVRDLAPYVDIWVVGGIGCAFLLTLIGVRMAAVKGDKIKRARKAPLGDADWMTMQAASKLFPPDGEIVIGECYRPDQDIVKDVPFDPGDQTTWGRSGKVPLLTYKLNFDSTHMLFFAGSGGFKTTSNVIPTALLYSGPVVCLDPSAEIAPVVVEHRRNVLKRTCHVLDPKEPTTGFNVLDWIETSPQKEEDIVTLAHMLLSESSKVESSTGNYFQNQAHNLLSGLLAHICLSPDFAGKRNLRELRTLVSQPEPSVLEMLRAVQEQSSSRFIRETLGVFTNMTEQTFSGVYSTASKDTQWLSLDAYAKLTCGDSFSSHDLAKGDCDVFLNLPAATLRSYPGIGRVIIGSLLNAMTQADGVFAKRALFMLDEVDLLGYMRLLEESRDRGRKYGITLMLFYQALGQLEKHFDKQGAKSWLEGSAFTSFAAIKSMDTAKEVSAACGDMTVEVSGRSKSAGTGGGKATESLSAQRRPLIMPHEITQKMRKDEQIIIVQGHPPLRCGRAIYFRRRDMAEQARKNRFAPK